MIIFIFFWIVSNLKNNNNLKNYKDYELKLDEGYALFKANSQLDAHDETVIETIICGLNTILEANPRFITIKTDK